MSACRWLPRSYREWSKEIGPRSIESTSVPSQSYFGVDDRAHGQDVTLVSFNVFLSVMVQRIVPGGL